MFQQDIVLGTLTVRENLWFSANLRLPRSVSKEIKKKRIEEILYELGLTGCADTKVDVLYMIAAFNTSMIAAHQAQLRTKGGSGTLPFET